MNGLDALLTDTPLVAPPAHFPAPTATCPNFGRNPGRVLPNFDVLERQDELKQAQLRRVRAIVDWHKAAATISSLTGDLLDEWGVNLDEKK